MGHGEGEHNYGLLNYGGWVSVLHTLFAHNKNRDPALGLGPAESINNTAYNVRHGFVNHNETYLHELAEALACGSPPIEETTGDESSGDASSGESTGSPDATGISAGEAFSAGGEATGSQPTGGGDPSGDPATGASTSGVSEGTGGSEGPGETTPGSGSATAGGDDESGCACKSSDAGAGLWALLVVPWLRRRRG